MWNLTWEVGCCVALVCINNKDKTLAVLLAASESTGEKRDIVSEKTGCAERDQNTKP